MTANALSVLYTADGDNLKPTIRTPKQLPIVIQDSFRLILRVNIDNMPLRLLSKHLKEALVSNASFLDISSSVSSPEDHVLLVLDYIILDYRFSHLSAAFEDTVGSTSTRDEGLFLPLRELLDQLVRSFVAQLVRQLPEAFGSWKDSLAGETVLARHAARHLDHMLCLSTDDAVFQRNLQKQLKRIDRCLRSTKEELAADLGQHILVAVDEELDSETLDIRTLLPFAVQTTYKQNVRPRRFKAPVTPSRIPLDLLDDVDPTHFISSQDTLVSTTTLSDDEMLQLDSPLFPSSQASSIQEGEGDLFSSPILSICSFSLESPPPVANSLPACEPDDRTDDDLTNDGDLDLDSDAGVDYVGWGAKVGTADGSEHVEFDADAWIDLDFAYGEVEDADADVFVFGDGDAALLDLD